MQGQGIEGHSKYTPRCTDAHTFFVTQEKSVRCWKMRKCQEEEKENEKLFYSLLTIKNCQRQLCVYRVCVYVCTYVHQQMNGWRRCGT